MVDLDDPLLALILRFVVDTSPQGGSNEEFLDLQIQTLKKYLAHFPDEEQGARTMEWIEQQARRYREDWQRRRVSHRTLYLRCADCPLADRGVEEYCEIHEQWLYLLRRYTAGTSMAPEFVEGALRLLQVHKDQLKVRTATAAPPSVPRSAPLKAPQAQTDSRQGARKPKPEQRAKKPKVRETSLLQGEDARGGSPRSARAPTGGKARSAAKKCRDRP